MVLSMMTFDIDYLESINFGCNLTSFCLRFQQTQGIYDYY